MSFPPSGGAFAAGKGATPSAVALRDCMTGGDDNNHAVTLPETAAPSLPPDPLDWPRDEWVRRFAEAGIKPYHADAAWAEAHRRLRADWMDAPSFPSGVRHALATRGWAPHVPPVVAMVASRDGFTRKFLLRLADGETIETVLMHFRGRATACIGSQVGCAMGCVFCATGQSGFRRHLRTGEIVAQALHVARILASEGRRLRNIVLMGQGEPLHNYEATLRAIDILTDERGLAVAADRITLSTVGIVPGIRRLADERRRNSLAVSLHGATDAERTALVPAGRRWPLEELMGACRYYTSRTGRRIFFEWTLIEGRNDGEETAHALGELLRTQQAHVNLIPLNPTAGFEGEPARAVVTRRFQEILAGCGVPSTVRQRRGIDIAAGCGQLAGAAEGNSR